VTKWTADALAAPHTQRHLDAIPQGQVCKTCGQPRRVVDDNETLGIKGVRLLPCECEGKNSTNRQDDTDLHLYAHPSDAESLRGEVERHRHYMQIRIKQQRRELKRQKAVEDGLRRACISLRDEREAALARIADLEAQLAALTPPPDAELDALVERLRAATFTKGRVKGGVIGQTIDAAMRSTFHEVSAFDLDAAADAITALRAKADVKVKPLNRSSGGDANAGWTIDFDTLLELRAAAGDWGTLIDLEAVEGIALAAEARIRAALEGGE
jgi:hypothetical protein